MSVSLSLCLWPLTDRVGCRSQVELAIGEAVFSRTYKCVDTSSNRSVCLKIIKNNKEYFDQGVDEIRLLQYIASQCDVDAKHLVRLLDFFYFREHLIIVTEVRVVSIVQLLRAS